MSPADAVSEFKIQRCHWQRGARSYLYRGDIDCFCALGYYLHEVCGVPKNMLDRKESWYELAGLRMPKEMEVVCDDITYCNDSSSVSDSKYREDELIGLFAAGGVEVTFE